MKIVLDTNVILNAAMGRAGSEAAQGLIQAVVDGEVSGVVTANSITDIHYIVRKRMGEESARFVIRNVLDLFDIAAVDGEACFMALNTDMDDYEDALLAVCAEREDADYIATNDKGFISADSPVQARLPQEILEMM